MTPVEQDIQARLFALQDAAFKDFQCKLIPTVSPETVIGVRTPALRALAKQFSREPEAKAFLECLPHAYFEENNLHGFLLETIKAYDAAITAVERFLPYIDNWATCDLMNPKAFCKNLPALLERIQVWIASGKTYTVRFGVGMLMRLYLEDAFTPDMPAVVANINGGEDYYVNMMIAWYFATALYKQPEAILPYFTEKRLPKWTHNKAIQKSLESYRIPDDTKAYLRSLKIK
ncbi:MAG: DNA alkylation repair protein [Eubacteriales bacterium]|nr:DNA alkylation repair protein [Eubacteriales bacterium]